MLCPVQGRAGTPLHCAAALGACSQCSLCLCLAQEFPLLGSVRAPASAYGRCSLLLPCSCRLQTCPEPSLRFLPLAIGPILHRQCSLPVLSLFAPWDVPSLIFLLSCIRCKEAPWLSTSVPGSEPTGNCNLAVPLLVLQPSRSGLDTPEWALGRFPLTGPLRCRSSPALWPLPGTPPSSCRTHPCGRPHIRCMPCA